MNGRRQKGRSKLGYWKASLYVNRAFNLVLAIVLGVLCIPLVVVIALLILATGGRPIFYVGTRLGKHKKPFRMYKFRTLVPEADKILGPQLFCDRHKLLAPMGKFLRETRLDELPQLLNIIKGDMDFVGPRPERPEVYEHICRHIRNYDRRFLVNPGLVGIAQVYTPHNTHKRLRTYIDNKLIQKKQQFMWDACMIVFTVLKVVQRFGHQMGKFLGREVWQIRIRGMFREKRALERIRTPESKVFVAVEQRIGLFDPCAELIDINEQALLMRCDQRLPHLFPLNLKLQTDFRYWNGLRKTKSAVCKAELYRERRMPEGGYEYVLFYEPVAPLDHYMVLQYFLKSALAQL